MRFILDNNDGYNVDLEMNEDDLQKNGQEVLYDIMSLLATMIDEVNVKIYSFKKIEDRRESSLFMLDTLKKMLEKYYDSVEKEHDGVDVYEYMVGLYDDYLRENKLSEDRIKGLLNNKKTDIDIILDKDEIRFSIVEEECGTEILVIDKILVSDAMEIHESPIKEAFVSNAVATIIYDKLYGDTVEVNPARKKGAFWFEEQVKEIVKKL